MGHKNTQQFVLAIYLGKPK